MDPIISNSPGGGLPLQPSGVVKKEINTDVTPAQAPQQVKVQGITVAENPKSHEQVVAELQKAIDAIQGPQKSLEISVHEKTHAIMIKVLNKETGELIREVPPEKILDLAARMMEITGIIVDKKI